MNLEYRNKVVSDNIGLVGAVLKRFNHNTMPREDMYQAGCMGLIEAATKYTHNRGVKFSTYATMNIRNHILKAIEAWEKFYRDLSTSDEMENVGFIPVDKYKEESEILDRLELVVTRSLDAAVESGTISQADREMIEMRCGIGFYAKPASIDIISTVFRLTPRSIRLILKSSFSKLKG